MLKDTEVAKLANMSKQALSHRKKTDPGLYEIIRLGAICKKFSISEEEIMKYIELKGLICNNKNKKGD